MTHRCASLRRAPDWISVRDVEARQDGRIFSSEFAPTAIHDLEFHAKAELTRRTICRSPGVFMNTIPLAEPEASSAGTAPLAWVHRQLATEAPGAVQLTSLLPELARTFEAAHVGLAGLVDGIPVVRRWLAADGGELPP